MTKTAVVLDVSTTTYCLLPVMNELWTRLEGRQREYESYKAWEYDRREVWEATLKAQLTELLTLNWLKKHIDLGSEQVIFLAYDWKDKNNEYWRHQWLRNLTPLLPTRKLKRRKRVDITPENPMGRLVGELPPEPIAYKGGRDYSQNDLNRLKKAVREVLATFNGVVHLQTMGYEADDQMALVCQVNESLPKDEQCNIVLCCNDSDILGLVSERVAWFDLPRQHYPLVRANLGDINKWRVEVKHTTPLEKPSDLWIEKAMYGDKADNLPATGDTLLTLPAINLNNPPEEHKLSLSPINQNTVVRALKHTNTVITNQKGRQFLRKVNVVNVFS